jgi:hypothetical protein
MAVIMIVRVRAGAITSTAFGYIAPSNWKKVKTRPGQKPYWANEVTGATSWDQPPPDSHHHKHILKRSTITSYGFARQPHEDPKDDFDTAVFESPRLLSLPPPPTKKYVLEITVNLSMKMNLGV